MRIQKIRIEGFKSYYTPYEFDFDKIKGLWKVSGPVGSGKTTIGEAILFGLFGTIAGKNIGDLVSWGKKNATVEIWCYSNNHNIYIKRNIHQSSSSIYVEVDGEELIFTNKRDAQQQLENDYYDISRVTMELLCVISFNNFKSLATLNKSETKQFLDQVLGFYTLTEYSDACKKLKQENDVELNKINTKISNLTAQIQKLEELSNVEIIDGNISDVKACISSLNDRLKAADKQIKDYIAEQNKGKLELVNKQSSLLTLGKNKKKEIDFIEKGTCPTCGAPIDQSQLEIKRKEKDLLLEQYQDVTKKIDNIIRDMDKTVSEMHKQHRDPIVEESRRSEKLLIQLEEQSKRLNVNNEQILKLQSDKDLLSKDYDTCLAEGVMWSRLNDILSNDVRSKILESFIPTLNSNIMKYSQELHQPYIVSFDNNFKCSVTLCGYNECIPISSLSTGQLKTVDMIIILGVLGTIIGNNSTNVIFLDELFSNLDGNLRNDMCSVLHNFLSPDDTMFVISHQDLDERYFNGTIKLHLDYKGQFEKHSTITITENIKEGWS